MILFVCYTNNKLTKENRMKKLDYENWKRKEVYEFFSAISDPFYMVTFRQDVTELYEYVKKRDLSFYYGMIWLCTKAINDIEAYRIALKEGELIVYPQRRPSFTDLKKGEEQFYIVTTEFLEDIDEYCRYAKERSKEQTWFIDSEKETDDLIYFSCLPWIDLCALTNERDRKDPSFADDSIPHVAWGKYTEENGRKILGISLEVNHRFIDGVHIGMFAERMDHYLKELADQ